MPYLNLGLIGYPLGHSRSPAIHEAGLRALGLAGGYRLFPVPPLPEGAGQLRNYANRLRSGEIQGLNVTIPHKQSILPLVDQLTPTAQVIGAVNTLLKQDGQIVGENTDAQGFLADLQHCAPEVFQSGGSALVLGAGGAARAIVYALNSAGFNVIIAARRLEEAQKIESTTALSVMQLDATSLSALTAAQPVPITLLVNTTSVGMAPDLHASPWPDSLSFPAEAVVYDLVYNPLETQLTKAARQAGLRAFTGIGMLVEQAALAFELWTGVSAPRDEMRQAVEQV